MTKRDDHVEELLDRYRTGELDAAQGRRVEAHLASCEACRSALAALDAFSETVARAYAAENAARALGREPDWGRLRAAIVGRTSGRERVPRRSWLARHAPQAALAAIAFVAVGVLWQQGVREPADAGRALRDERPAAADPARANEGFEARTGVDAAESERKVVGAPPGSDTGETAAGPPGEFREQVGREGLRPEVAQHGRDEALDGRRQDAAPEAQDRVAAAGIPEEEAEIDAGALENIDEAVPAAPVGKAALKVEAAPTVQLERFRRRAREALEDRDATLAERALAQWRDSLAPREELPADLRRAAVALADSLAEFLATRP